MNRKAKFPDSDNSIPRLLFSTADTALAAYIYSQGYEYKDITIFGGDVLFHFIANGTIDELHTKYISGVAAGNIIAFHRAYKKLLKIVYELKYKEV